jgi:acyl-CoA reductase-like NAD-dependent aldehyde dehydrogenase
MHEAGLPAGCLNTIIHRREDAVEIASTMIAHPYVKKINFTGSTTVGAALASLAGKYLKPTLMELGGKAPSIICEDADINKAAIECAKGAFIHAGQICMSTERIIVHENILSEFRTALKGAMDKVSSLMGVPQLINAQSVEKNEGYISDAVAKGAKALYSDAKPTEELKTRMAPVIIEGVKPGMNLYHTESFGPTVSLIAVSSDEEALRVANDTAYGLSASIFSRDLRKALRMSRKIETGAVHINSMTIHDEAALPHGGVKDSGFGRFNGLRGLEEWVWTRVVTYDE